MRFGHGDLSETWFAALGRNDRRDLLADVASTTSMGIFLPIEYLTHWAVQRLSPSYMRMTVTGTWHYEVSCRAKTQDLVETVPETAARAWAVTFWLLRVRASKIAGTVSSLELQLGGICMETTRIAAYLHGHN